MKKFSVILISLSSLLVGLITGILTNGWSEGTEDRRNTTNSVSFDEIFNGLDYTNTLFSNVDKYEMMDAKSNMLRTHNLYKINQVIQTANEENRSLWQSEKIVWDQLSNDIMQFIDAKMTEQWETGKTGTAGSSYCVKCRYDIEIVRAIFLETIVCDSESMITNNCILSNLSYYSKQIPLHDNTIDLITDISKYFDDYISAEFLEWRNEYTPFSQWLDSTSNLIMALKNHLYEYAQISNSALDSLSTKNANILLKWILQQISQIIKIGD